MLRLLSLSASVFALTLTACSPADDAQTDVVDHHPTEPMDDAQIEPAPDFSSLETVLAAPWRSEAVRARDEWRHPAETLTFFQIDPSSTVMEVWPGRGWYTDVIAPWVAANGGTYVAAWPPVNPDNARSVQFRDDFVAKFDNPAFGDVTLATMGPEGLSLPEGVELDAIVTFRNTHSYLGRGIAETVFEEFYGALKPGGVLGVVQHRLPTDMPQDPRASTGYVQQDIVIALATEAGFELAESSEINANMADTADHPFGVWTLPPVGRSSAFGEPADPEFDRAPYDAIGESDRMTLRFIKPVVIEDAEAETEAEADDTP